ncbi:unnamed protein product [Polarella glacialis]|uniref:Uncharacterized protein n=1 Tax=Polarella glacialis TaxID=89957 RepID=A0A813KEI3_POLGL|nr:unnamed protein product [Polarella glacialis]CAE8704973.1 unnamed protein product [Polarella glacialis]
MVVVWHPRQIPGFEPGSTSEAEKVASQLQWWPRRLVCKGSWQLGSCELSPTLVRIICFYLQPCRKKQLLRHLSSVAGGRGDFSSLSDRQRTSVLERSCSIVHMCLHSCEYGSLPCKYSLNYRLCDAADMFDSVFDGRCSHSEALEDMMSCTSSVVLVKYASRAYCNHPTHVAELLGRLDDGRYFFYQDLHANKNGPVKMQDWPGRVDDINNYMALLMEDFSRMKDCFVMVVGRDLHEVLVQLDLRSLLGLVQVSAQSSPHMQCPSQCDICAWEQLASSCPLVARQGQLFAALGEIYDRLLNIKLAVESEKYDFQQEDQQEDGWDSDGERSFEPWLSSGLKCTMECAIELLHTCPFCQACQCNCDIMKIVGQLEKLLRQCDDYYPRHGSGIFETLDELVSNLSIFMPAPEDLCMTADSLAFVSAACPAVFTSGPHAGRPLAQLVDALKAGAAKPSDFYFEIHAVWFRAKLRVFNGQEYLWCLREYAGWVSMQQEQQRLGEQQVSPEPQAPRTLVSVRVWPLIPHIRFCNKGEPVNLLQHFLSLSTTTCDGEHLQLHDLPGLSNVTAAGIREDTEHSSTQAAEIDMQLLSQELLPIVTRLEQQMLSVPGHALMQQIRQGLAEVQRCSDTAMLPSLCDGESAAAEIEEDPYSQDLESYRTGPAEYIDPAEAQAVQEVLWATSVEARIAAERAADSGPGGRSGLRGRVMVLTFNRHPTCFDDALLACPLARELAKAGVDMQPPWAKGAKILAWGIDQSLIDEARVELARRHVVVCEKDEHAVHEALKKLEWKKRPTLKPGVAKSCIPQAGNTSLFQASSSGFLEGLGCEESDAQGTDGEEAWAAWSAAVEPIPYVVNRTFIEVPGCKILTPRSAHTW